jgi:hypothetical protein
MEEKVYDIYLTPIFYENNYDGYVIYGNEVDSVNHTFPLSVMYDKYNCNHTEILSLNMAQITSLFLNKDNKNHILSQIFGE